MGTTYLVRLDDVRDALDSLDESDGEALRKLIGEDEGWIDLDQSGDELGPLLQELGVPGGLTRSLDAAAVRKLAAKLAALTWEDAEALIDGGEPAYLQPYYDELCALVRVAAQVRQGIRVALR